MFRPVMAIVRFLSWCYFAPSVWSVIVPREIAWPNVRLAWIFWRDTQIPTEDRAFRLLPE